MRHGRTVDGSEQLLIVRGLQRTVVDAAALPTLASDMTITRSGQSPGSARIAGGPR